jgi:hypothetical protein
MTLTLRSYPLNNGEQKCRQILPRWGNLPPKDGVIQSINYLSLSVTTSQEHSIWTEMLMNLLMRLL